MLRGRQRHPSSSANKIPAQQYSTQQNTSKRLLSLSLSRAARDPPAARQTSAGTEPNRSTASLAGNQPSSATAAEAAARRRTRRAARARRRRAMAGAASGSWQQWHSLARQGGVARFNGLGVFGWFLLVGEGALPCAVKTDGGRGPRPCGSLPHWSSLHFGLVRLDAGITRIFYRQIASTAGVSNLKPQVVECGGVRS